MRNHRGRRHPCLLDLAPAAAAASIVLLAAAAGWAAPPPAPSSSPSAVRRAVAPSGARAAEPHPTSEPVSLPIYLTDEERQHLDRIGEGQRSTEPPPAPVRNCAEWEPVQGVLIRYPLGLPYDLIRDYADHTTIYVLVSQSYHASAVSNFTNQGVDMSHVEFLIIDTNSIWTRDYGPWFVFDGNGEQAIVDHVYNRPRPLDDQVNWLLGPILGVPVYGHDIRHTGGNYMTDGHGISFSTNLVWNENPGLSHQQLDDLMFQYLGIETYNVLPDISSYGIHHIDTWGKLLDEETVLVKQVAPSHPDYQECEANAATIAGLSDCYGRPYHVVRIDCPSIGGSNVASYTNSLILNNRVYVPLFNIAGDAQALATYEAAMPGYEVVGYDGSWLSDDAIHCRGKGIMDIGMLYVDHDPIQGHEYGSGDPRVAALVRAYSGAALVSDSLLVHWRLQGASGWWTEVLTATAGADSFAAAIPEQLPGAVVEYYVSAVDGSGRRSARPWVAPAHVFSFEVQPAAGIGDGEEEGAAVPALAARLRLAPNPFRPQTRISFALGAPAAGVRLSVYAPTGRLVRRLLEGASLGAGRHAIAWDGKTASGEAAAAGVYLIRLETGDRVELRRGVLLR